MRTYIYIDGFNLFHRSVQGTAYKWLDLKALCTNLLQPHNQIEKIRYFTARVSAMGDPQRPIRQQTYIRALEQHISELEVHYGFFLSHEVTMPLARPTNPSRRFVKVIKTEEKGTDVNLSVHLLNDAWLDKYDCAVILSNDSDLVEAINLVKERHKKLMGLIIPNNTHPSRDLIRATDFTQHIRKWSLRQSQLPNPIPGTNIRKPSTW